ncbi:MAG: hypothetical protein Q8P84_07460 [Deltaproteobacteria bacterium]|nr:hypothetical protein [Deltaproteobacteria bacterium]
MKKQRHIFASFVFLLATTVFAASFGTLPVPKFNVSILYPQGWQHDIQQMPGALFVYFTPDKEAENAPSVMFTRARFAAAVAGAAAVTGSLKGLKIPNVPGAGGRWSSTQKQPTPDEILGPVPENCKVLNSKKLTWLQSPAKQQDMLCTENVDGKPVEKKTRMVATCLTDGTAMLGCDALTSDFTADFSKMCDQIIRGTKKIKR